MGFRVLLLYALRLCLLTRPPCSVRRKAATVPYKRTDAVTCRSIFYTALTAATEISK